MRFSPWLEDHLATCERLASGAPPGWPFQALGKFGGLIVLRNAQGQVQSMPVTRLTRRTIAGLFDGDTKLLRRLFRSNRDRGWHPGHASEQIIVAASARGPIDPQALGLVLITRQPRRGPERQVLLPRPRRPAGTPRNPSLEEQHP